MLISNASTRYAISENIPPVQSSVDENTRCLLVQLPTKVDSTRQGRLSQFPRGTFATYTFYEAKTPGFLSLLCGILGKIFRYAGSLKLGIAGKNIA